MTVLRGPDVILRPFRSEEFEFFWKASERWIELTDPNADRDAARKQVRQRVAMSGTFTPEGIEFAIETEERLAGRIQARQTETGAEMRQRRLLAAARNRPFQRRVRCRSGRPPKPIVVAASVARILLS